MVAFEGALVTMAFGMLVVLECAVLIFTIVDFSRIAACANAHNVI